MSNFSIVLPRHIAIVMDGNGRWAQQRHLPRTAGHHEGIKSVRRVIEACVEKKIAILTLFAFSSENWRRPPDEVSTLMALFLNALKKEVSRLHKNNIRLRIVGERNAFSQALQQQMAHAEALTQHNTGLQLNIAANYGGRWDIMQAAQQLAYQVQQQTLPLAEINETRLADLLSLSAGPDPDLFIRTGGEMRISNFLLWQLAYTELYFTPTLWPDFNQQHFQDALADYARRQRRFGQTGAQIAPDTHA